MNQIKSTSNFTFFYIIYTTFFLEIFMILLSLIYPNQTLLNGILLVLDIYAFYLGYKIFLKKYNPKIEWKITGKKWIYDIIKAFILILFFQSLWLMILRFLNVPNIEMEVGLLEILEIILIAPILEEIIFRGFIQKTLEKVDVSSSILITTILFGFAHRNLMQFITAFYLGIICSQIDKKYNSLLPGIILHILNNLSVAMVIENQIFNAGIYIAGGLILITSFRKKEYHLKLNKTNMKAFFTTPTFILNTLILLGMTYVMLK